MAIVVQREKKDGGLVTGTLTVNGQLIGTTYENARLMIAAGAYPGRMRYVSGHNFVQDPFGTIAKAGEVAAVFYGTETPIPSPAMSMRATGEQMPAAEVTGGVSESLS